MDLFSPKIAYASLDSLITNVDNMIINPLIGFLFALAIVYFLYGMLEFLMNQDNDEKKTTGKSHMLWGIIGITIMMGVWAILGIIVNTLGVSDQVQISPDGSTKVQLKP
jgi:uncharacterized membrane protein YidH (DUF202 family)